MIFVFTGCVDVDRSPFIYDEVKRAQENLVLTNDLHLLYLVTTPDMITDITPDMMTYVNQVGHDGDKFSVTFCSPLQFLSNISKSFAW